MLADLYHAGNACGAATVGSSEVGCHLVASCQDLQGNVLFLFARTSFKPRAMLTDEQELLLCGLQLKPPSISHALWVGL
jgi:hypothetical protein